jgi:ribosome-associated protein
MAKKKSNLADSTAVKQLCDAIAEAMLDKKAHNVVRLDLSKIDGAVASSFMVCHADSTTQVEAIADNVEEYVRTTLGQKPVRREGADNALWMVYDYVDVMVHIFQTQTRDFYQLEALWADAKITAYEE